MVEPEVVTLVERSRGGDKRAFGELVRRYQGFVFKVAYGIVPNVQDMEDVAQEAFLKAYTSLPTLRDPAAFTTWLARLTVRLALNKAERAPRWVLQEPDVIAAAVAPPGELDPEASAERKDTRQAVHQALRSLPSYYRAPLVLRDLDGYSYGEIANLLNIAEGTVKSRIHAARRLTREYLKKRGV